MQTMAATEEWATGPARQGEGRGLSPCMDSTAAVEENQAAAIDDRRLLQGPIGTHLPARLGRSREPKDFSRDGGYEQPIGQGSGRRPYRNAQVYSYRLR